MASTEWSSSSRSWLMIRALMGIFAQPRLEPQRAFHVEVVGRLVQQKQVRLGEQRRRHGDPHAPSAGELGHRALEIGGAEKPSPLRISAAREGARSASISPRRP